MGFTNCGRATSMRVRGYYASDSANARFPGSPDPLTRNYAAHASLLKHTVYCYDPQEYAYAEERQPNTSFYHFGHSILPVRTSWPGPAGPGIV